MRYPMLALCLGVLTTVAPHPVQCQSAPLTGTWTLNTEKSDRAGDTTRVRDSDADSPGMGRRGYGGGRRHGGEGGGSYGGGRRSGGRLNMGPIMMYLRPLPQLVVLQSDTAITISDPSGEPRTYHPDGRKESEQLLTDETLEITARWKDARLTVERKFGGLGTIKETYSIDPSSKELIIDLKMSGGKLPRTIELRRVYDPAAGGTK